MIENLTNISERYKHKSRFVSTLACLQDVAGFEKECTSPAYRAVIKNIEIPVSSRLEWGQVMDMRKDTRSLNNLRAMHMWINDTLSASSEHEASERIEEKIQLYQEALEKHGATTTNGIIASVFSGIGSITIKPDESGIVFGLTIMGGIAIAIQKSRIENKSELRKPGLHEAAWLHEIHNKPVIQKMRDWFSS